MITQTRLKQLITYNPDTGQLSWLNVVQPKRGARRRPEITNRQVEIDSVWYSVNRLVHLYMTGTYPARNRFIKHLDGDLDNLKWSNLHLAGRDTQHLKKPKKAKPKTGVFPMGNGRYLATVMVGKKKKYLGTFETFEAAQQAISTLQSAPQPA